MLLSIGVYAITAQPQIIVSTGQSGVSRLSRSGRVKRVWFIDLPVPVEVKEALEEVAEQVIYEAITKKEDKKELLDRELLSEGLVYSEKYLDYLQEVIAAIRNQMLVYAQNELERRIKNRKAAIYLLLH